MIGLDIIAYRQSTRFNANVMINGVRVGGMNTDQALQKLTAATMKNDVYIGNKRIINGEDMKAKFTSADLPAVQKIFEKQRTWLPTFQKKAYSLNPQDSDKYRSTTLKKQTKDKIEQLNRKLKAPKDAYAYVKNGTIYISKSVAGSQYDLDKMMRDYDRQEYSSEVHLDAALLHPVKEGSQTVKNETKALKALMARTVTYQVQDKTYTLKASEWIKNVSVSADMKFHADTSALKNKIAAINQKQSTLNKKFTFKTHAGKVISVQGQSYGWALNVSKETQRIEKGFESGKTNLKAYYVYGVGYSTYGIGYHNTANNGIGNNYAEVSIADQKIWIYKNGKPVVSTSVVTGRHDTHEDTPKGLWYIMYKEAPSTLEGSEVGNPNYSVKVKYWAPFTMSGCGFHDASWRTNWGKEAYLSHGSGGCVNTPPKVMQTVYNTLEQNEPVIVY